MPRKDSWTPKMYERLAALYPFHTNKELEVLTGWPTKELQYRAGILGVVKTKETEKKCLTRVEYIADHEQFIRENFDKMTNGELAQAMGFTIDYIRVKCHGMGLYRMRLEYWTEEQVQFLKDNYRFVGDKELSEIFEITWPKNKRWTIKHIEKKRNYLKLHRTKAEIEAIRDRNVASGRFKDCPVNRWLKYGVAKEGEIRMWRDQHGRLTPRIKIDGKFVPWNRWSYEQKYGPVPEGMNVVFSDNDPSNTDPGNLSLVTNAELSKRNSAISSTGLSDNYITGILSHKRPDLRETIKSMPDLIDIKRKELLLNRAIKQQQNGKSTRATI